MVRLLFKKFAVLKVTFLFVILGSDVWISVTEAARSGCSNALGMQSRKITRSQLDSYTYHSESWGVDKGRLHNSKSWCSKTNDAAKEYFQIDLLRVRHVSAIATQGVEGKFNIDYYVKTYMIKYSYDGAFWMFYEAENGADVKFTGNSDANSVATNYFRDTFVTRYLRIYPKTYQRDMCLRVEVYGCSDQADDCSRLIKSSTGSITSPEYPVSYPSNKDCTWLIWVSFGRQVALMFTQFDVKRGSGQQGCKEDFVEVRNGLTDISGQIGGRYCNGNKSMLITTPRNVVRILFHSGSTAISVSHRGFKIDYLSITPGSNDVFTAKSCDGDVIALDCSSTDHTINILHAAYGTFPYSCGQQHTSATCAALDVKSKIVSKCQDYKVCRFSVSGSLFSYSCPGGPARRQLEVFYQCTSRNIKTPAPKTPTPTQPSTQRSTVAPSTVPPITTNSQPSHSFTDETTTPPTIIPSTEPLITQPTILPSQVVFSVETDIPPTNSGSKSAAPPVGGKEAQTGKGMPTGTIAGVIVVALIVTLVAALLAVFFIRRKRQQKYKEKPLEQTVEFTPERQYSTPENCPRKRCPLDVSNSAYETVNILYESADNHSESSTGGKEDHNAYASCSVPSCLPKITENPLYKGVSPPFKDGDEEGYELVKPPSVASHNYDSPSDDTLPKVKSINNPNYEKTLELKNHEYAVPDLKPSC
ncbi:hypothetical protein ACROYT_G038297 [Oculina patagonica]